MFGFALHPRKPQFRPRPRSGTHVVARLVPAAPCGWIFFDGRETLVAAEDGTELILPGGAFFAREAQRFSTEAEAREWAGRLNDASPCLDRPWRVRPMAAFEVERVRPSAPRSMVRA